ncbi:MAG: hypothetical protein ACJA11_002281 [Glaciecola sp.]|jgi:hypothetical protein
MKERNVDTQDICEQIGKTLIAGNTLSFRVLLTVQSIVARKD